MNRPVLLGSVLTEVKAGIGDDWAKYPTMGATREGLAPAKERPGKSPERYKPVFPGTVFYNPMRIMIGSIAYVDDDDPEGITSPDYVVFRGNEGVVDSRWFYYWLRSPLGHKCIVSLARGAVRERMLFTRLAKAEVILPDYDTQRRASEISREAKHKIDLVRVALMGQLNDLEQLPHRIIAKSMDEIS